MSINSIRYVTSTESDDLGNLYEVDTPEIKFFASLPNEHAVDRMAAVIRLREMAEQESNFGVSCIFNALADMIDSRL